MEPEHPPYLRTLHQQIDDSEEELGVDVLLVTVTKVEALAVLGLVKQEFDREPTPEHKGLATYYDLGVVGGARTWMVRSEMGSGGPSGSALTIADSIEAVKPTTIIMIGIAFGMDEGKQAIGDVLVSRQLLGYELQRVGQNEAAQMVIRARGDRPSASTRLLQRFRDGELSWNEADLYFGLMLSGDKLVDNFDFREQLRKLEPEAIGGEMEGAGLYAAAQRRKVDWIVVKAICDWADGTKHQDKKNRQKLAAQNAAGFVLHVLERGGFQSQTRLAKKKMGESTPPSLPDSDTLPDPGPLSPVSYLPYNRNPLFSGRKPELLSLAKLLLYEKGGGDVVVTQTAVASGLGGIGKTQLAVEFAHRYGRYFPGGVFWLSFAQPESIAAQIAACGGPGHLDLRPGFNELPLVEQVKLVQQAWQATTPRLLLFDACEEEELLAQWRPTSGGCRLIVTSRRGRWDSALGITPMALPVLPRVESVVLLRKFRPDLTNEEAEGIAAELGDLPLALHLAGSFLHFYRHEVSPDAYLAQLQTLQGAGLLDHPSLKGRWLNYQPTGHELHVARTFALSFERLRPDQDEVDVLAYALLARAAYFAPGEPLPRWLLAASVTLDAAGAGPAEDLRIADALARLVALGLVEEVEAGAIQLHQLLAHFVQGVTQETVALTAVEKTVIVEARRLNQAENPALLRPWQTHLHYVTHMAQGREDEQSASLRHELGYYFYLVADHRQAQLYLEQALAIREEVLGEMHADTAQSWESLGELQQNLGDYEGARPYHERALAIRKQVLGEMHADTADSLNNLGVMLLNTGDYEGARPYLEQALAISEQVLGEMHPDTAGSLDNLGLLLEGTGDYEGARPYFERALAIREQVLGAQHSRTATSLNNLGLLLRALGDYEGARPYLERALTINVEALGEMHPFTVTTLSNLGLLLKDLGDYEGARPYFERGLAIDEEVLGEMHPYTASSVSNLGLLLKDLGDYEGAQPYLERALAIREQTLGSDHPTTANSLMNLGLLYQDMGRRDKAYTYLEKALVVSQQALGSDHPITAKSLNYLGQLLQVMGKPSQGRPYLEQALAIREEKLGANHPDTAETLHDLGSLLQVTGQLDQAYQYLARALAIRKQELGPNHLDTGETLFQLGLWYQAMGDLVSARTYLEQAVIIFEIALGADHEKTQVVRANLEELQGD